MTIYKPTIKGGPAGDLLLARWAELIRNTYALGELGELTGLHGVDEAHLELFAAFLAGAGKPNTPANLPNVDADDEELIYVFVGGTYREAKRAALERRLDRTWRWLHIAPDGGGLARLGGYDPTDLVFVDLGPVDSLHVAEVIDRYRPPTVVDVDTGGRT